MPSAALDANIPRSLSYTIMDYTRHFVLLILCTKCIAVNINHLVVPPLVQVSTETIILDCDYDLGEQEAPGLVIKWFFNGSTGLVYQWIPPRQPQVIGLLKGKVDLSYRITEEPLLAHRAMKIIKPTTHLSGNYTCVVSTDLAEDTKTKTMLVYSPGKSFQFFQEKKYVFLVTLTCIAEDLYPRPVMTILSKGQPLEQVNINMTMDSWGMYTVEAKAVVHDDNVIKPWEEFTCVLFLPLANYTVNKTTIYHPGLMPTTHIAVADVERPQEHQANGTPSLKSCVILTGLIIFHSCIIRSVGFSE